MFPELNDYKHLPAKQFNALLARLLKEEMAASRPPSPPKPKKKASKEK